VLDYRAFGAAARGPVSRRAEWRRVLRFGRRVLRPVAWGLRAGGERHGRTRSSPAGGSLVRCWPGTGRWGSGGGRVRAG